MLFPFPLIDSQARPTQKLTQQSRLSERSSRRENGVDVRCTHPAPHFTVPHRHPQTSNSSFHWHSDLLLTCSSSPVGIPAPNPTPKLCTEMILGAHQSHVGSSLQRHFSGQCKLFGHKYVILPNASAALHKKNEIFFILLHVCPNALNYIYIYI